MEKIKKIFNPLVSIIIPVYNGANYMREAIDSALAQTYKNIEIIVVNDGSTDNTDEIARSYGDKIRYFKKENGGVATALNLAIEKSKGEYISWLSHDDIYLPIKIERQIETINYSKDKDSIIASAYSFFREKNKIIGNSPKLPTNFEKKHPLFFLFRGYINGCALLINKIHFERVGGFDESLPTTQDFDLWFRILRNSKIKFIQERLVLSRSHSEQGSKVLLDKHVEECDKLWISMFEKLTNHEKCIIDGSLFNFYDKNINFLESNCSYDKCLLYAKRKRIEALKNLLMSHDNHSIFFIEKIKKILGIVDIKNLVVELEKHKLSKDSRKHLAFPIYGNWNDKGGLNRMISMLVNELSERYKIFIICTTPFSGGYELLEEVSFLHINHSENIKENILNLLLLFDVDVFINSHNCADFAIDTLEYVSKSNIKTVAWNHEHYFLPYGNKNLVQCCKNRNNVFSNLDAVVWLSSFSANTYSLFCDNSAVIHNFSAFVHAGRVNDDGKENKRIISVARHNDHRKRFETLIRVFEKVLKDCPEAELDIIGEYNTDIIVCSGSFIGNVGQLIEKINKDRVRINLIGWVDNIDEYYRKSKVNVLCSYHEGFGLSLIEAASYGLPSFVFDDSGFDDIIKNDFDGFIIPDGDVDMMAQKISFVLNNQDKYEELEENAFKMNNKFNKEEIVGKWITLFDSVIYSKNKTNLNKFLSENYRIPVSNKDEFVKKVSFQYERSIKNLLEIEYVDKNIRKSIDKRLLKNYLLRLFFRYKNFIPRKIRLLVKNNISGLIKK